MRSRGKPIHPHRRLQHRPGSWIRAGVHQQLPHIIDQSSEGIALTDEEGVIVEWNQSMAEMTGIRRELALDQMIWDIQNELQISSIRSPEMSSQIKEMVQDALRKGQDSWFFQPYTVEIYHSDGRLRYLEGTAYPIKTRRGHRISIILRDVTEKRLAEKGERAQRVMAEALRATAEALTSSLGLDQVLDCILTNLEQVVPHDAANIMLVENGTAQVVRWHNYEKFVPGARTVIRAAIAISNVPNFLHAAQKHYPNLIADTHADPNWRNFGSTAWIRSNILAPIEMKDRLLGFINVDSATPHFFTQAHIDALQMFAYQTAIAINNAQLFANLQAAHEELTQAYDATIAGWAMALDLRDQDTQWHTMRVTEWTLRLAKAVNVPEELWVHIRRGAILHDIGKISIPDKILQKPGPLTAGETQLMRMHPVYALRMLSGIDYLKPALDIPYYHHEKWDGSGYPLGLKGEEIPLAARIFAIVDVWDALTSDRIYRKAWSEEQARSYMIEQSGKQFDPRLLKIFMQLLENQPFNESSKPEG